ncbi:MAG: aminotransferase class I/II-fold pyridoxal phosphate-dependent enzyme [Mariprofundaceae bacterium]
MVSDASAKLCQPRLDQLGTYPFEQLNKLFAGRKPDSGLEPIDAGAGEPRLQLPPFAEATLMEHVDGFSRYPSTRGSAVLRESIAGWLERRYGLSGIDPGRHILSANGTREALYAVAHALVNPETEGPKPYVLMPNPMYQIYLGAAVTAGARPYFLPCTEQTGFAPRLDAVPTEVWDNTALIYVCSPSNPTGWVADAEYYAELLQLADAHDFYVIADECYSEIYSDTPPVGLLEVAQQLGRKDFSRCLVMNSLSKRSAMPGLRSGFIAGDAALIERFAKLRSYTGPATPLPLQMVAARAWSDETHVEQHLAVFQDSLNVFYDTYGEGEPPAGSFFAWLQVEDDEAFAAAAFEQQSATVLPGRYLGAEGADGCNPGAGYVRAAMVDGPHRAEELAHRLKAVRI